MDIAFMFSTANQLRHAFNLEKNIVLVVGLLIFSLVLQVTSSILLLVEHMALAKNYRARTRFVILMLNYCKSLFYTFSGSTLLLES